jgi:hypothetical protein
MIHAKIVLLWLTGESESLSSAAEKELIFKVTDDGWMIVAEW